MSIAKKIRRGLSAIPEGEVFDYRRFAVNINEEPTLTKTLSRLALSGEIVRLEKGKYYKPRQTRFGPLRPAESQIIKALTIKNDQPVGYLTGTALYNRLGLTTQVPNVLVIARKSRLPDKELYGYKIKFVTRSFKFGKRDIPLLQLLDALHDIKEIPDTSVQKAIPIIVDHVKNLSMEELKRICKLALEYNPATRALLGALLELSFPSIPVNDLRKSLNPLSRYKFNITDTLLPNKSKWYIE